MSRVTKLHHQRRAQRNAKLRRRLQARTKSNRLLREQSNYFSSFSITSRNRREARQHSHHRCACGHRLHGIYGCLNGCAWNTCNVVSFEPIIPSPLDSQFMTFVDGNTAMVLSTFRLPRI